MGGSGPQIFSTQRALLCVYAACRHNDRADHDDAQQRRQDVAAQSVLCHRHGPVCDRLLPVCVCRSDGVCNVKLLLVQHAETQLHATQTAGELKTHLIFLKKGKKLHLICS